MGLTFAMISPNQPFVAFFSYVRRNDEHDRGKLTELRKLLEAELWAQTGKDLKIFQDTENIHWGMNWKERITSTLEQCTFLIAIITPSYLESQLCRFEFEYFLEQESRLQLRLILPILYIDTQGLKDKTDKIAVEISRRQWIDWQDLRFVSLTSTKSIKTLESLAKQIRDLFSDQKQIIAVSGKESVFPPNSVLKEHPLTPYQQTFVQIVSHFSGQLGEAQHEEKVRVAGLITAVRPYMTETNKSMGFVTLADTQGNIELVLFTNIWKKINEQLKVGQVIIVEGKVDARSTPPKVLVDEVHTEIKVLEPLGTPTLLNPIRQPQQITIILRSTGDKDQDKRRMKTIYGTLISFHGKDRFSFQLFEQGMGYLIDFPHDTTRVCPELLERVKKLMGEESWRVEEIEFHNG
jgi:hypothetical protein